MILTAQRPVVSIRGPSGRWDVIGRLTSATCGEVEVEFPDPLDSHPYVRGTHGAEREIRKRIIRRQLDSSRE